MVPTWDLVLLVFLGASVIYGFLMGQEKVLMTLLGAYVGLVIANQWGASAYGLLTGGQVTAISSEWIEGNVSVFTIKVVLFVAALLIVALRGGMLASAFVGGRGLMGLVVQVGYSLLSAALIAGSILEFLPEETKLQITDGSLIAGPLLSYYSWLLVMPVLLMAIAGFLNRGE
ncbi:hypothetical protein A2V68_01090 [candidate division Kazan bacterium RBG_13_50_9]|uniref:Colicin V production protein n=1 Tax=candidate division Kazan bacterium RBG_13_50_9 TaxID=1798535 RepID=A0A1F4NS65_UNCK3|nr:MAG: hypothetical protein A2V68_01090 [candidate division Kazan bacterium RBG_13_50_9]